MDRRQKPRIVEEFRTVLGSLAFHHPRPFVAIPLPLGTIFFADGQEADTDHLVG